MREIKFKALGESGKMHYWSLNDAQSEWVTPDECISDVMQFTGLKDKNGVDIYEGDIIKNDRGEVQQVEYDNEVVTNCGCCNEVKVVGYDFSDFANPKFCTIIGNIHEHPELLK